MGAIGAFTPSAMRALTERHYTPQELANLWGLPSDTIHDLFVREP
jgi:hypothetical protein